MTIIYFNDIEKQQITKLAEGRNTKKGIKTRKIDRNQTDLDINIQGLCGEFAVAKYMGWEVDTTLNSKGGDKGYDFNIDGILIDVKYSAYTKDYLMVPEKKVNKIKSNILILTKPIERDLPLEGIRLVGWISRVRFMEIHEEKVFNRYFGNTYYTSQLTDVGTLKKILCVV